MSSFPNPDPKDIDYFKVDAPSVPSPDPEDIEYFETDATSDPNPDPKDVDYFGVGKTNKGLANFPNPDPKDLDYFKVDAPNEKHPGQKKTDPKDVDSSGVEKTTMEPVDSLNPEPLIDYWKVDAPIEECEPKDDYFRFGKSNKELVDLFYGDKYTFEELLTRFHAFLVDINGARLQVDDDQNAVSIHALAKLYSEYVDFFEAVLKNSHHAAMLAEGRRYKSNERGYYDIIREQFGLGEEGDADREYKIPDEEQEEPREKSPEEWNKHQGLILDMTNALNHFDYLFTIFQYRVVNGPQPDTTAFITERRVWHPKLRAAHKKLGKPVFGHNSQTLWDHMATIAQFLQDHRPDQAGAWEGGVLQGNEAFEATFKNFKALEDRKIQYDFQRKGLCRSSAWLLREACADLQLDPTAVDIEWKTLVDPQQTPAYTRRPITCPSFTFGTGTHDAESNKDNEHRHMGILHVKRALGYDPDKDPQANAENNATGAVQANTTKRRRQSGGGEAGRPAKRRQTEAGAGTGVSADAAASQPISFAEAADDVDWIEGYAAAPLGIASPGARHGNRTGLHAIVNGVGTGVWHQDVSTLVRQVRRLRDRVLAAPATEAEEEKGPRRLLDELEVACARARAEVESHRGKLNNRSLKLARLAAYKLIWLRALTVRRAAQLAEARSGSAGGDDGCAWVGLRLDMEEHRRRRLVDWTTHEQVNNEADQFRIDRLLKSGSPEEDLGFIAARNEMIDQWALEIEALQARVAARQAGGFVEEQPQPQQPVQAEEEEEEAVVVEVVEEEGHQHHRRRGLSEDDRARLEAWYGGTIFGNRRLHRGGRWLDTAFYNNDYNGDSRRPGDGVDAFRAGGPRGYETLPAGTTWEKLQYMVVLTHWRFQQAWEIRL